MNIGEQQSEPRTTSVLTVQCRSEDKVAWNRAARARKLNLAGWVIETLNAASRGERNRVYDPREQR